MTERELLETLFNFLVRRSYIQGDEASIRDMVLRYKQPPLTMYHQVCMQMTVNESKELSALLEKVMGHFDPNAIPIMTSDGLPIESDDAIYLA